MQEARIVYTALETSPGKLEAALTRLSEQAGSSAGLFRFFLYFAIAAPPGSLVFSAVESGIWSGFLLALLCSVLLTFTALAYNRSLRRELRQQLEQSGLYLRLALDGMEHDAIFERCPWPWNAMLPRNSAQSLLPTLRRIGRNLDFYLHGPRYHLWPSRLGLLFSWVFSLLLGPLLLYIAGHYFPWSFWGWGRSNIYWNGGFLGLSGPIWLVFGSWGFLSLVLVFWTFRRQVWVEELVRYLQASLHD